MVEKGVCRSIAVVSGPEGGNGLPFGDEEPVSRNTQRGMMMKTPPASPFIMSEANLLLEILVIPFDPPSQGRAGPHAGRDRGAAFRTAVACGSSPETRRWVDQDRASAYASGGDRLAR